MKSYLSDPQFLRDTPKAFLDHMLKQTKRLSLPIQITVGHSRAILLGPTGNIQGTQKVFDIRKGVIKNCRTIRNLPFPQAVIKSVHDLENRSAHKERQHKLVFLIGIKRVTIRIILNLMTMKVTQKKTPLHLTTFQLKYLGLIWK